MASALILFAHGARDARWAAPFEQILARVAAHSPERAPMLAFLELMSPDLGTAIAKQTARGFTSISIVPLFLGQGGHLREDIPRLVDEARAAYPELAITIRGPAGEDDRIIEALANYCVQDEDSFQRPAGL